MSRSQDDLVARASDPNAELATLHELAQNYPGLRPYIAANPRTYPALLDWLAGLGDPAINAALASRGSAAESASQAGGPTQALPTPIPTAAFPATEAATSSTASATSAASAAQPQTQAYPAAHAGGSRLRA